MTREELLRLAAERYGTVADYPWAKYPRYAILRHGNRKWYGALMTVERRRLGLDGDGAEEVLNVKCDPDLAGTLADGVGILPAYHMNKEHWLTLVLGAVPREEIEYLLDISFNLTK